MAARVTIGGLDHLADIQQTSSVRIELVPNARGRCAFVTRHGYLPSRLAEVVCYAKDGATPIWGGLLLQRTVQGIAPSERRSVTACECVDFSAYYDWCVISLTYTGATTLQVALDALVAALPVSYGVTLDATDYSGIALEPFTWVNRRVSDCLRELRDRTGLIAMTSPLKVLSLGPVAVGASSGIFDPLSFDPTAFGGAGEGIGEDAPFSITDAAPNCIDLLWEDPTMPPVTTVRVLCGSGTALRTQTWVSTGTAGPWVGDVPAAGFNCWVVVATPPGDLYYTVDDGVTGGGMMSWNWVTNVLTSNVGAIASGVQLSFQYLAQYPFTRVATTGASPDVVSLVERPDVFDVTQGQEIANGLLAQLGTDSKQLTVVSALDGWAPGQTVDVNLTARSVVGTFVIMNVSIDLVLPDTYWRYTLTCVDLSAYPGTWLDQWRALLKGA